MKGKECYIKAKEFNKERLAELVLAARGSRTSQQFAKECGVTPSTITRILNKTNKSSSKEELIYAIAENADLNSGITLDQLMSANGMVKQNMETDESKLGLVVKKIILQELLDRGASIRKGAIRYEVSKSLSIKPDMLLLTDAIGTDLEKDKIWFFEILIIPPNNTENEKTYLYNARHKVFQKISRFSFVALGKIDLFKPAKFSIIITEKMVYDDLIEEFGDTNVPTNISFIYIDLNLEHVVEEFILPRSDNDVMCDYFSTVKIIKDDDCENNDDVDEEI